MNRILLLTLWIIMSWSVLTWCWWPTTWWEGVAVWDTIKVLYEWRTSSDGELFDTNVLEVAQAEWVFAEGRPYELLEFTVWEKQMIPWFDAWVVGMKLEEEKTLSISPEDWYWVRNDEAIQEVPTEMFSQAWIEPKVWEQIVLQSPVWPIPWTVIEIWSWTTTVDMNHFLAWKELEFKVTIKEIITWWAPIVPDVNN